MIISSDPDPDSILHSKYDSINLKDIFYVAVNSPKSLCCLFQATINKDYAPLSLMQKRLPP